MYVYILYIIHTYVSRRRYPAISCGVFYLDILAFLCVPRIPMGSLRVFRLGLLWDFLRWFPMWRSLWGVGCPMDPSMRAIMGRPVGIPYGGVYWVLGFPNGGFYCRGSYADSCRVSDGFSYGWSSGVSYGGPIGIPICGFLSGFIYGFRMGIHVLGFLWGFPLSCPLGFLWVSQGFLWDSYWVSYWMS